MLAMSERTGGSHGRTDRAALALDRSRQGSGVRAVHQRRTGALPDRRDAPAGGQARWAGPISLPAVREYLHPRSPGAKSIGPAVTAGRWPSVWTLVGFGRRV